MDEPVWKRYRHMPIPVFLSMTEMQKDAFRSIAAGEPLEEWKARWQNKVEAVLPQVDEDTFRREREGTWSPQEPS